MNEIKEIKEEECDLNMLDKDELLKRKENFEKLISQDVNFDNWEFIDFIESINIKDSININNNEIINLFKEKYKDWKLEKITKLIELIDKNNDGFISYLDLVEFLLEKLNYKSTFLAWKYIASKIFYEKIKLKNFFNNETEKKVIDKDVFINSLEKDFNLKKILCIELFENLYDIINNKFKRDILLYDIKNKIDFELKLIEIQENLIANVKENTKKENDFNIEIKNHIKLLMSAFIDISNLQYFINAGNFKKFTLGDYKIKFIKNCGFDYFYGIKLFYKLKKEEDNEIYLDKFYEYLINEIEEIAKEQPILFKMDVLLKILTSYNRKNYFIKCFEELNYMPNGIPSIEIKKALKQFYKNLSDELIKKIVLRIDDTQLGFISYKNLFCFLIDNIYNENDYEIPILPYETFIKTIAEYLDDNNLDTKICLYEELSSKEPNENLTENIHTETFMEFLIKKIAIKKTLEKKLYKIIQKTNIKLNILIQDIILIRNTKLIHYTNNKNISKELISSMNKESVNESIYDNDAKIIKREFDKLNIDFSDIDNINLDNNFLISINELINYIKKKTNNIFETNEIYKPLFKKLVNYLKNQDKQKNGLIKFNIVINLFNIKNQNFYLKYIAMRIIIEFNSNVEQFLSEFNIEENSYLTKEQFNKIIMDNLLSDINKDAKDDIYIRCEDKDKEKFSVKLFISLLNKIIKKTKILNPLLEEDKGSVYEIKKIEEIIKSYENTFSMPFSNIFEIIYINNKFGKVNVKLIKKILKDKYKLIETEIFPFINQFSDEKQLLFDLLGFANCITLFTKYKEICDIDLIVDKIIENNNFENKTSIIFNSKSNEVMDLIEFLKIMKSDFDLSCFESIILFDNTIKEICNYKKNRLIFTYEINKQYFIKFLESFYNDNN